MSDTTLSATKNRKRLHAKYSHLERTTRHSVSMYSSSVWSSDSISCSDGGGGGCGEGEGQ